MALRFSQPSECESRDFSDPIWYRMYLGLTWVGPQRCTPHWHRWWTFSIRARQHWHRFTITSNSTNRWAKKTHLPNQWLTSTMKTLLQTHITSRSTCHSTIARSGRDCISRILAILIKQTCVVDIATIVVYKTILISNSLAHYWNIWPITGPFFNKKNTVLFSAVKGWVSCKLHQRSFTHTHTHTHTHIWTPCVAYVHFKNFIESKVSLVHELVWRALCARWLFNCPELGLQCFC